MHWKPALGIVVIMLLVALGAYVLLTHRGTSSVNAAASQNPYQNAAYDAAAGLPPSSAMGPQAAASAPGAPVMVAYTDQGFSPRTITIRVGQTVRFVNNSSRQMWVASGQHPIHSQYDGTTLQQHCANGVNTKGDFDECTGVPPGTVYSFTFPKAGTFPFHNHLQASDTGTVIVE